MTVDAPRTIVGIVLAGGRGRRMGGQGKSQLMLGGQPLLTRAVDRLAPQVSRLVVSANGAPGPLERSAWPVVRDPMPGFAGPLAGLLAGMNWALETVPDFTHVVTVAVDTPFFPQDLVARLSHAAPNSWIAVATSGGRVHPVFALVPRALAPDLAAFLGEGRSFKVADWLARHALREVDFAGSTALADPFFNINTPDDLARAEALAAGCARG